MSKVYVATRLEEQTTEALKVIAAKQDRTVAYLLRKAAEEYTQRQDRQVDSNERPLAFTSVNNAPKGRNQ